jgi:hypothetical protein
VESALLRLLISAGLRVRIGMKYGVCGSDMTATRQRPGFLCYLEKGRRDLRISIQQFLDVKEMASLFGSGSRWKKKVVRGD